MAREPRDDIDKFILEHYEKYTDEQLIEKLHALGITLGVEALRKRRRAMGVQKNPHAGSQYYQAQIERLGIQPEDWKMAWDKSENLSVLIHNPDFKVKTITDGLDDIIEKFKQYAPKYPKVERKKLKDNHLLVINMTDTHIGEDTETAIERCLVAIDDAITKSAPFNIDQILFIGGNDILTVDTAKYTTTKGTQIIPQLTWPQMFDIARQLYVQILERLSLIAPIHYLHVLSNHDEVMGWTLSQTMEAHFRHSDMTFDVTHEPRKYYHYHNNLLAFTHGHSIKEGDIPLTIATEARELWGITTHRYAYMGHLHHSRAFTTRTIHERNGIELHWLRSSQDRNDYERSNGWLSKAGISTYVHHPMEGQVAIFHKTFLDI